jgi:ParB-like chromosome segregation protein Spo0J
MRCLDELRPHPSYSKHRLTVSASQLSALTALDDQALEEPIVITRDGLIIDGYARVELARMRGRTTILCIEYDLTEEEALRELLRRHLGSKRLNAFCRILLARELEPWFKKKALANQQAGGENKGSSKLTEAEKVDVTAKIAEVADVSVGNLSKVKRLLRTAIPELLQALHRDEISIHRAWLLSKEPPAKQREELALAQCKRNIKKDMRTLALRNGSKSLPVVPDPSNLFKQLSALESSKPGSFRVFVSNTPGRNICLTKELLLELGAQGELLPTC